MQSIHQEPSLKQNQEQDLYNTPPQMHSTRRRSVTFLVSSFAPTSKNAAQQLQEELKKKNQPPDIERMQKMLENQEKEQSDQALAEINNKYQLLGKIGQGGFGFVYKATKVSNGDLVAIKFEKETGNAFQQKLEIESKIIDQLNSKEDRNFGFPMLYEFHQTKEFSYMVTNLLGLNLEQLLSVQQNGCFSLKTVCMIGYEIVQRLEVVHQKNYIYRDIKPENITIGKESDCRQLYLIDFGLAKPYKCLNGKHIEERQRVGLVGTPRYASINSHLGKELSRRDDFESLGYMLIYLLNGYLPWMKQFSADPEGLKQQILELKQKTTISQLCQNSPVEFQKYFKYVRSLSFTQQPNYNYLRQIFTTVLKKEQQQFDYSFDWDSWIKSKSGLKYLISLNSVKLPSESLRTPWSRPVTLQFTDSLSDDQETQKNGSTKKKIGFSFKQPKNEQKQLTRRTTTRRVEPTIKQLKNDLNQLTRKNTLRLATGLSISRIPYCTEEQLEDITPNFRLQKNENVQYEDDQFSLSPIIFPTPKFIKQIQFSFAHPLQNSKNDREEDRNEFEELNKGLYQKTTQMYTKDTFPEKKTPQQTQNL